MSSDAYRKSPAQLNRYKDVIGAFIANPTGYSFALPGGSIKTATVDLSFLLKALYEDSALRAQSPWSFDTINLFYSTYVFKPEITGVIAVKRKRLVGSLVRNEGRPTLDAYDPVPYNGLRPDSTDHQVPERDRSIQNIELLNAVCVCLTHGLFRQPVEFYGHLTSEQEEQLTQKWPNLAFVKREGLTVIL